MQCNYHATIKESLDKHKKAVHEGVKYSCRQCENPTTNMNNLAEQKMIEQAGAEL